MIRYRPFLNTDPPLLVEIWRHQRPFRGQMSSVSRTLLDHHVFSKPFFDRQGLILAVEENNGQSKPLGFVHAGFGPNQRLSEIDNSVGIISQLKLVPGAFAAEVGQGLLQNAVEYLQQRQAKIAHVGGKFPYSPFYLGLYGGSRVPGVLENDEQTRAALADFGFQVDQTVEIMERSLVGFRMLVDRDQMAIRRQFQIKFFADPLEASWWESCTFAMSERDRFQIFQKNNKNSCGTVSFWDVQPLASQWGTSCRGLYDLNVAPELRGRGVGTFLVGESLRHLMTQGIGQVEVQMLSSDLPALGIFKKLGFEPTSRGILMSKPI